MLRPWTRSQLHVHDVLIRAYQAVTDFRHRLQRDARLRDFQHDLGKLDTQEAPLEGFRHLVGALLCLADRAQALAQDIGELARAVDLLGLRRLGLADLRLRLQSADLLEDAIDFHGAHVVSLLVTIQAAGTSLPASRKRASLYRRVRGLMPRRSAASRRLPWPLRSASRMSSRTVCPSALASDPPGLPSFAAAVVFSAVSVAFAAAPRTGRIKVAMGALVSAPSLASSNWMCSGRITGPLTRMRARCNRLSSSRTLPGHG